MRKSMGIMRLSPTASRLQLGMVGFYSSAGSFEPLSTQTSEFLEFRPLKTVVDGVEALGPEHFHSRIRNGTQDRPRTAPPYDTSLLNTPSARYISTHDTRRRPPLLHIITTRTALWLFVGLTCAPRISKFCRAWTSEKSEGVCRFHRRSRYLWPGNPHRFVFPMGHIINRIQFGAFRSD